jgi:hypothetical protein
MSIKQVTSEPLKTILIVVLGMLVVYLLTKWHWALGISLIMGILGLLSGFLAKKIEFLWMKLSWLLSFIIPNILLTLLFFIFLTPTAWLSKIFGFKNQLFLKNTSDSLFKDSNKRFNKAFFEKSW